MVVLGKKVKDSITGFSGVATARIEYLNGCISIEITSSKLKDGKPILEWFDEQRVDKKSRVTTGGPGGIPPKRSLPRYD